MANGNGNGISLTPAKTIGICISITVAINTLALTWMQDTSRELDDLRDELSRKTDHRYRQSDAKRDFRVVEEQFNNVLFRFQRNEQNIQQCIDHLKKHP